MQTEDDLVHHCRPQVCVCRLPAARHPRKPIGFIYHAQRMIFRIEHLDCLSEDGTGGEFEQHLRKRYANVSLQCKSHPGPQQRRPTIKRPPYLHRRK